MQVSAKLAEPDADTDSLMAKMDRLQTSIDACNGWELDRQVQRATDALRCPPGAHPCWFLKHLLRRAIMIDFECLATRVAKPVDHSALSAWHGQYLTAVESQCATSNNASACG